jgi:transcription termination/antitermination protein NusA
VINALAPAEVSGIVVDEERHSMDIVVDEDNLAQAIGRGGQNVRLASELTGWELNIMTEDESQQKNAEQFGRTRDLFMQKLNVDEEVAGILVQEGFNTVEEVAYVPLNEMLEIEAFDEETVNELRSRARNVLLTEAIVSEEQVETDIGDLLTLEGMDNETARLLATKGVTTKEGLADLAVDDVVELIGIDSQRASDLIMAARAPWFV